MKSKHIISQFADLLIKRKRKRRAIEYTLLSSFIGLSIGIILSLPLRYFLGTGISIPLLLLITGIILSFIYGFLGIENKIDVLKYADTMLDLNEKLSAAYQFADSDNPYSELLGNEAVEIIEQTRTGDIFNVRFSRRDPFQPLLLALFFFLWMSSFSFLQISDDNMVIGDMLLDIAGKIDAVNSGDKDRDVEDIADEYRKLGNRIQDHFLNDKSIENEVRDLSQKLERQIEELSREGVDRESETLSDEEMENQVFQLNRKKKMSEELSDILDSLMKSFSLPSNGSPEGMRRGESSELSDGDEKLYSDGERQNSGEYNETDADTPEEGASEDGDAVLDPGSTDESDSGSETAETEAETDQAEDTGKSEDSENGEKNPLTRKMEDQETGNSNSIPGNEQGVDEREIPDYREEQESGEFGEDNIEGELLEGEQMKSFIRALPHIVEPDLQDMKVLHFYRNQLETAIDREILPEGYESVIRDYFLSIGVLNE